MYGQYSVTYSSSFQDNHILRLGMISGIETGGLGGSVNWQAASPETKNFMQEKNTT